MRNPQKETPITREEMKQKMLEMWKTRERQDAELREKYGLPASPAHPREVAEKPLTREEMKKKVQELIAVREKQDDEVRRKYKSFLLNYLPDEQAPNSRGNEPTVVK